LSGNEEKEIADVKSKYLQNTITIVVREKKRKQQTAFSFNGVYIFIYYNKHSGKIYSTFGAEKKKKR
jgi:hypothetical protein